MPAFKTLPLATWLALSLAVSASVQAQTPDPGTTQGASAPAAELTEGEIRKIDKENRKLTIRHGEIRNLQMPGMTMVFQVRDAAVLEQVKVGDKVLFKVERGPTGLLVTALQPAAR